MKEPKKTKSRVSRRLADVDIDKIRHALMTVLKRETNHLLDLSWEKKLGLSSSRALINYLELLKELQDQQEKDLEGLSDDELESRMVKNTKKGEKDAWG